MATRVCWAATALVLSVAAGLSTAAVPLGSPRTPAPPSTVETFLFTPDLVDVSGSVNVERAVGRGVKDPAAVLTPEHPWETSFFFFHSVLEVNNSVWLYYGTWTDEGAYVCVATSTDHGATFTKPSLGITPFRNSTQNNIVLALTTGSALVTFGAVFEDTRTGVDPEGRFKMTSEHGGNTGMDLWQSPDGLHWTLLRPQALPSWFADTQPVVYYDPRTLEYRAYGRLHAGTPPGSGSPRPCSGAGAAMRQIGFARTSDPAMANWSNVTEIFGFEGLPECVDVYNSAAVQVHNAYFIVPSEYRHFPSAFSHAAATTNDGVLDVRLAVSSDGLAYDYVSEETFVERGVGDLDPRATGDGWHYTGDWDSGVLFAARGYVETTTHLHLFYWGTQRTHGDYPRIYAYPNASTGIGRLTFRKHGWFSYNSVGSATATLVVGPVTLPPLPSSGSQGAAPALAVKLNLQSSVRGVVRLGLLDPATGQPFAGYDANSSTPLVAQNSLSASIQWLPARQQQGGGVERAQLGPRQSVKLSFEFTYTKLFSFELEWLTSARDP